MAKTPKTTSTGSRPVMGTEASRVVANSAQSPNLQYRPKGGAKGGSEPATANNRSGHQERLGATYAPQMPLYVPNAAEASATGRNVRLVPSAVGNRDFYNKRQFGQVQQ